jgi:hypothetical protein
VIRIELQHIKDCLWILGVVFSGDGRFGEKFAPLFGHSLEKVRTRNSTGKTTDCKRSGYGIKAHMHFVYKVRGVAYTHERTSRIHVILPAVEFFIVLE